MNDQQHLPDKLCFKCSDALLNAVQIRSICIESEKLLKKKLSDLNIMKTYSSESKTYEKSNEPIPQAFMPQASVFENEKILDYDLEDITAEKPISKRIYCPPSYKMKKINTPCEICGKNYKRSYIMTHLKTHNNEEKTKEFSCKNNQIHVFYPKFSIDFNR